MAKEDELYQAAPDKGSSSADEVSKFGTGGGNVVQNFCNVVSIASKFGMRRCPRHPARRCGHASASLSAGLRRYVGSETLFPQRFNPDLYHGGAGHAL